MSDISITIWLKKNFSENGVFFPTLNDDSAAHCPVQKKNLLIVLFFMHRYQIRFM